MSRLKLTLFGLMLPLAVVGCAPRPSAPSLKLLPPAAWAMQPPSNSVEKLDQLFSISKRASSAADKTEIFAGLY